MCVKRRGLGGCELDVEVLGTFLMELEAHGGCEASQFIFCEYCQMCISVLSFFELGGGVGTGVINANIRFATGVCRVLGGALIG